MQATFAGRDAALGVGDVDMADVGHPFLQRGQRFIFQPEVKAIDQTLIVGMVHFQHIFHRFIERVDDVAFAFVQMLGV